MSYIDNEDRSLVKDQIRKNRKQKFAKDRRGKNGNKQLAKTDGLKPIRKYNYETPLDLDDEPIDLRRVRSRRDFELE